MSSPALGFALLSTLHSLSTNTDTRPENFILMLAIPGFFVGPLFAAFVYSRYRNKRARYFHEQETQTTMHKLCGSDQFKETLKKHLSNRVHDENSDVLEGKRTNQESAADILAGRRFNKPK